MGEGEEGLVKKTKNMKENEQQDTKKENGKGRQVKSKEKDKYE